MLHFLSAMSHFRDWLKDGNDKTFKCSVQDLEPGSHEQSALSSSWLPIASQAALKTMSEYKAMYSDARVGRMLWLGRTTGKSCEETIIKSKIGNGIFCQVSRYWRKRTGQGQCLDSIYMLNHSSTQRANFFCSNSDQFVRNTAWTPPYCTKASAWHSMRANTCSSSEPVLNWHSWHHWSKQQSCFGLEH